MQGLLFPIIMLTVTLVGGGLLLLVLKSTKKRPVSDEMTLATQTAQQFINVRDVKDKYLYTKDGLILMFLRVHSISIDLYSKCYGILYMDLFSVTLVKLIHTTYSLVGGIIIFSIIATARVPGGWGWKTPKVF